MSDRADVVLRSEYLEAGIKIHGAELRYLNRVSNGTAYMWNADPAYWGRTSPVLFPFVGAVRNKVYRVNGQEYPMGQHGFARDKDFEVISKTENEVWFGLDYDEETLKVYPFRFRLEIGYRLKGWELEVMWKVKNADDKEIYFAIGAHPAFFCPLDSNRRQSEYFLHFADGEGRGLSSIANTVFGGSGMVTNQKKEYPLEDGRLPIDEHLFDGDALVIEYDQIKRVALLKPDQTEYLAVEFDAPLAGIWSPPGKQAPFVCIEPWYGRCDKEGFDGDIKDREWENALKPEECFEASYKIIVSEA